MPYQFAYLDSLNMSSASLSAVIETADLNSTTDGGQTLAERAFNQNFSSLFSQDLLHLNHLPLLLPHRVPAPPLNAHDSTSGGSAYSGSDTFGAIGPARKGGSDVGGSFTT